MTFATRLRLLSGKIRRWYLCRFRPGYVRRQIARRRGECRKCGSCCALGYRCVFLNGANLCRIYDSRWRFITCVKFPIDERDIRDVRLAAGVDCGFYFAEDEGPDSGKSA